MSLSKKNKSYTTDGKVIHYSSEKDINKKLISIIGKKFEEYRKVWDAANKMEIVTEFPLFLHVDMNQECNYKCPHCIIGHLSEVKEFYDGNYLNFEDYKKIVNEGAEYKCPSISPQGNNEPFLTKNLHEYISYAYKKGFIDIMLNCNGSAITKKRSQEILDSGLTRLRFSLDAYNSDTYSKVRVGSIELDKVKKNIDTFLNLKAKGNYKLPVVGVSFCKIKQNENEIDKFFDEWKDKVDIVTFQKFVPPTPNVKKYEKYYASDQYLEKKLDKFHCVQPYQRIIIKNGFIYPCCVNFNRELILGSLKDTTIFNAWNSEKMKNLRKLHKKGEHYKNQTCKKCVDLIYPEKRN